MKPNNKLTVSIASTAFNEEKNIKSFLDSVCSQTENMINIKEIIVISDASTDATAKVLKSYKDSRLKTIIGQKRLGKPSRLNQLLKVFKGNVLVVFDSDVILKDDNVVEKLVSRFRGDKKLGLASGNPQPLPAQTFLESAVNTYLYARNQLKKTFDFQNNCLAAHGRIIAFSRDFAESILFPSDILGDDAYSFLSCQTFGFKFYYHDKAIVWYRSPQNIKEYTNQASRYFIGAHQLYQYFDPVLIKTSYKIPTVVKVKILLLQLLKNPLGYAFLKIINLYTIVKTRPFLEQINVKWTPVTSSKRLFIKNKKL